MAYTDYLDTVQELYIAYYQRPADPEGLVYWANRMDTGGAGGMIDAFANSPEATALYGTITSSNIGDVIDSIYNALFNRDADADGKAYYTENFNNGTFTAGTLCLNILNGATDTGANLDLTTLNNKLNAANLFTQTIDPEFDGQNLLASYVGPTIPLTDPEYQAGRDFLKSVTSVPSTVPDQADTTGYIQAYIADPGDALYPGSFTLTNGSDKATANIFNADMVYNPGGTDRILSLQDEDELTGLADRTDNTLNAEIGNINADEATTATVTPQLNNIQIVNLEWTGNTTTVDVRYADAITDLNINKITADAETVIVNNITTPASNLVVADASSNATTVTFNYQRGVLDGDDTANLELDNVLANTITQNALGAAANIEGFETVNLNAINGVDINALSVNEMETLTITGESFLDIITLALTAPGGVTAPEYMRLTPGAIADPSAVGLLDLNASAFEGDLTLDITNSLGGFADPANSGSTVHGVVTGGIGDDKFWSGAGVAATTDTNRDVIDGGEGDNTLVLTAVGVEGDASISNIQSLELRDQTAGASAFAVDFDAFDATLANVLMRTESTGATTFTLTDVGADLASNGNIVLNHGITGAGLDTVEIRLKDASGADDTVAIAVENDLNTATTFNYTLDFDGDDADGDSFNTDGKVENISIADNDTEDNIVTLTKAQEHTGTVTLTGGVAGDTYTVNSSLVAATIDGSAQLSDLRLTVGDTIAPIADVTQAIALGEGDDILTFANIDDFDTVDSITDAGGTDTVRAAFSEDSTLTLTDIENLHIIATENVTLGMANADVQQLVILADIAADGSADNSPDTAEPFNVAAGVATTDVITLNDTSLTSLNFFADLDTDDDNTAANRIAAEAAAVAADPTWTGIGSTAVGDAAYKGVINDESTVAVFNGVTLANNTANALTVNINSSLDDVIYGATSYTLGQLTAHGITSMDIQIADEDVTFGAANALTTIQNIYAKNMTSLSLTAADDVTLGTVSGAALNNSLLVFDASEVGGDLNATVISLGDNAVVTLADGDNVFSALGSAGKDITITAGDGDNNITGSGQDDTITTGTGWDTVAGDRGDNVITTGAGNDTITAKDGNDTYDVGSGIDNVTDNLATGIDATLATNTVSLSGGVTTLYIDVTGNGAGAGDVDQMLAVGSGSDLTLSWTGGTLVTVSAVLDGRLATVDAAAGAVTTTGDANSNLLIVTGSGVKTFNAGAGNDVGIYTGSALLDGMVFNGGAGNDAAVGTIDNDIFTGGTGADVMVMADIAAGDALIDTVVLADGDSTASGWDIISGFDAITAGSAAGTVAGSSTAGGDFLDLASTTIAGVTTVNGTDVGDIKSHDIAANGVVTFDDVDVYAAAVMVGTGANELSLTDALSYLATNITGSNTVMFQYDSNGDGAITAVDSTFIFQDGANNTVIELVGNTYTGLESIAAGTGGGLINIG